MAQYEVNVEFGKCPLEMDEDELILHKKELEKLSLESIRSGNLYFDEHRTDSKHIPFILTPYSADIQKFRKQMDENWNLPSPRIVLFVISESEDSPSDNYRKISRKLAKGLVYALNTTEMWLCTEGFNYGFCRDIGKEFESQLSRRKKSLDKGKKKGHSTFPEVALIGICERDNLKFSSKFGSSKEHEMTQENGQSQKDICKKFGYFIIVEDTTDNHKGVSRFILNFSEHLTKKTDKNFFSSDRLPIMAILLHGKLSQVDMILGILKLGLPLIVLEGSGGLADILAYAYYQNASCPEGIDVAVYTESVLKPQVVNRIYEQYPTLSETEVSRSSGKIFDCIRHFKKQNKEYLTVLDLNAVIYKPTKLPHLLLKALVKAQASDTIKTMIQMKKDLSLSMDWNSVDVAVDEVFSKDRSSMFQIDGETFFKALTMPHREDFVSLFLKHGFVIHTFLNSSTLLSLFQNSLNREFFKSVVWESVLGFGANVEISRSFLDSTLIILIEELTGVPSLLNSYELDWNSRSIYDDRSPAEAERKAMAVLIMWAILSYRFKLVKTLMQHSEQPIHVALACSIILRKLETYVTDLDLRTEMEVRSKEFSEMASGIMTLCFESVPCRAIDVLHEKNRVWSYKVLMELAAFAKNKMFLAHPCCQKYLDNLFMGRLRLRDLPYGDITVPLWIKIISCNFLIFPMFFWVRFEAPKKKQPVKNKALEPSGSKRSDSTSKDEDDDPDENKKPSEPGFFKKLYYLWSAPISKFWTFMVFYTLFLALFSFAVIWPGCGNVLLDFFTCIWIATFIMDHTYQAYILNKEYSSMPLALKCLEISFMVIFLFIYVSSRLVFIESYIDPYNTKVILCLALLYAYYRLIFVSLPISSELGPMLFRVKRMITVDFTGYIRVTILIIISNGIVIHAILYPEYPLEISLFRRAFYDAFISFFLTPVDAYGSPNPKCIQLMRHPNRISFYGTPPDQCRVGRYLKPSCPNPGVWPHIFGLQYFIILRLIAVVLLFALFANTARKLEEEGKYIWKYQRYELIINFSNRLTLPPPLCLITFAYMLGKFMFEKSYELINKCAKKKLQKRSKPQADQLDENDFRYWKSLALKQHENLVREKDDEMTTKKRMETINALSDGLNNQRIDLRNLDSYLNELQLEIRNAHQYLEETGVQASVMERLHAKDVPQIFSRISPYPDTMVPRMPVSDNYVPWSCTWTTYDPISFTLPKDKVQSDLASYVDVDIQRLRELEGDDYQMPFLNWNAISVSPGGVTTDRQSWILDKSGKPIEYDLDLEGLPKNPLGRTGLRGRGRLLRWGPNHYVYTVITKWHAEEDSKYLDVVLMQTDDSLSLPGGYVHTENRYDVVRSRFVCEQVWKNAEDMRELFQSVEEPVPTPKKTLFGKSSSKEKQKDTFSAERLQLGYMDESTNTDQAWCEAEVWHYHYDQGNNLQDIFKPALKWELLTDKILMEVPVGQASILYSIAKNKKVMLEVV